MTPWLILGLIATHAGLAVAVYWYHRAAKQAQDAAELWQAQSRRLQSDLTDAQKAAADELARHMAERAVFLADGRADIAQRLVAAHPDLAREFLRLMLQDAAGTGPGAAPIAVPGQGAADRPGGSAGPGK